MQYQLTNGTNQIRTVYLSGGRRPFTLFPGKSDTALLDDDMAVHLRRAQLKGSKFTIEPLSERASDVLDRAKQPRPPRTNPYLKPDKGLDVALGGPAEQLTIRDELAEIEENSDEDAGEATLGYATQQEVTKDVQLTDPAPESPRRRKHRS